MQEMQKTILETKQVQFLLQKLQKKSKKYLYSRHERKLKLQPKEK